MTKVIFIFILFLCAIGCNRSGKLVPNGVEGSDAFDKELNTLKIANKGELFKIVEVGELKRDLMKQDFEKEEFVKKKQELLVFIENAPKLQIGYIIQGTPVSLTEKQIEKFNSIYLLNLKRNSEKPLMGNIGCGFNADYCLSLYDKKDRIDYIFCFSCNLYKVFINGVYQKKINFFIYVEEELKVLVDQIKSKSK